MPWLEQAGKPHHPKCTLLLQIHLCFLAPSPSDLFPTHPSPLSQEKTTGFIHWKGRSCSKVLVTSHKFLKGYFGSQQVWKMVYALPKGPLTPPPPAGTSTRPQCQSGLGGAHSWRTAVGERRGRGGRPRPRHAGALGTRELGLPWWSPARQGASKKLGAGVGGGKVLPVGEAKGPRWVAGEGVPESRLWLHTRKGRPG